jgi:hypothetical protein
MLRVTGGDEVSEQNIPYVIFSTSDSFLRLLRQLCDSCRGYQIAGTAGERLHDPCMENVLLQEEKVETIRFRIGIHMCVNAITPPYWMMVAVYGLRHDSRSSSKTGPPTSTFFGLGFIVTLVDDRIVNVPPQPDGFSSLSDSVCIHYDVDLVQLTIWWSRRC